MLPVCDPLASTFPQEKSAVGLMGDSSNVFQCPKGKPEGGPSESVSVGLHRDAGGVGSGMWKRLQIDWSQFSFTLKRKGSWTISGGDLSTSIQDRLDIFFLKCTCLV